MTGQGLQRRILHCGKSCLQHTSPGAGRKLEASPTTPCEPCMQAACALRYLSAPVPRNIYTAVLLTSCAEVRPWCKARKDGGGTLLYCAVLHNTGADILTWQSVTPLISIRWYCPFQSCSFSKISQCWHGRIRKQPCIGR